ncbi:MAG: rhodanese-like domain-containing protein [Mycobacteriales bacterium]
MQPGSVPSMLPGEVADGVTILDVREDDEWAVGHIAGSAHVPMSEIVLRVAEVPAADPLLVVCRVGARSAQVAAWLRGQGRDARNLAGGLVSWTAAGRSLVTDSGAPGAVA